MTNYQNSAADMRNTWFWAPLILAVAPAVRGGVAPPGAAADADADWLRRSTASGVVRAIGFDSEREWLSHVADTTGCKAEYAPGCRANAWDPKVKASGAGSVRFDIRSNTGQGAVGELAINFSDDYSVQFGANDEFWVQWRQRFDDFVISHDYREIGGPGGEWKQIILSQGDRRLPDGSVLAGYSCSEIELVVGNAGARDYPNAYIECGRYMPLETPVGRGRFSRQNQRNCGRGSRSGCLVYVPNEWMTFMVHLKLGPEGRARSSVTHIEQPGFINSTYELFVAREGQPFQIAHRQKGMVVPRGQHWIAKDGVNPDVANDPGYHGGWSAHDAHPGAKYGKIWLTPYHTNKDPSETHADASIWYDELIISRQAIAAPAAR